METIKLEANETNFQDSILLKFRMLERKLDIFTTISIGMQTF